MRSGATSTARRLWSRVGLGAVGAGAVVVLVSALSPLAVASGTQGAPSDKGNQAQARPTQDVLVTNGLGAPVPVTGTVSAAQGGPWNVGITGTPNVNVNNFPAAKPAALWRGTPYVSTTTLLNVGLQRCEQLAPVPAGMVLFAERAIARFTVPPGQDGHADVGLTPLGGSPAKVAVPSYPSFQVAGCTTGYGGSLELGVPVTEVSTCFGSAGGDLSGDITVLGYFVPAP